MLRACETYPEGMPGDDKCYTELDGVQLSITLKGWREESTDTDRKLFEM